MELKEIYSKLQQLGIPVAYQHFDKPQKLPYAVYYEAGGTVEGADGYNLFRRTNIVVELYTARKDIRLERHLEELFRELPLEKEADTFLKDENMHMTAYEFENITFIEED